VDEVVRAHVPDALVDAVQLLAEARVAGGLRESDVEGLVDEHELRARALRGAGERGPLGAQPLERGPVVAVLSPTPEREELERAAQLVEVARGLYARRRDAVAAVRVALEEALRAEAHERLAGRRARAAEALGEPPLAERRRERDAPVEDPSL